MLSRRTLLKTSAAAAFLPPVALARPDNGVSAYGFPLTAVRLGAGPFAENAARTHAYLRFLNADRLLHMFRVTAGLSSSATPCGGWESPTTELRGHSTGHVLTALAQAYASTGEAAFWNFVVRQHSYAIGGNSNGEYFRAPNRIASELSDTTCECCNTYNMLKLTRQLFFTDPGRGAELMDFYEKALYNHLLGAQNPGSAHGHHCYYVPLRAGGIKTYSNDYDNFTCCHGTGMETNTKYADSVFFHNANTLWVNLFIAATLTWPGRGITVRQETTYPETSTSRLTVTGSGPIDLRIRIPSWTSGAQVRVNGALTGSPVPGSYLTINRTWAGGDTVDISLPMAVSLEATPDDPAVRAVKHGPIVLAGQFGSTNLSALPTLDPATLRPAAAPLEYTAGSILLRPFYKTHGQRYSVYWNVVSTVPREAHYPFEEASSSTVVDATGNGWNGVLSGAASRTTGRTGRGVLLSGGNAYLSLPAGILAGAASFTVAAWVRIDTAATWARVFDFGSGTGSYLFLTPRSSAGTARYAITAGGSGTEQRIDAPAALPTGTWTHVAVTHTGNLGVLYVNGAEVARNSALTVRPSALGATTQNWIGRSQYANDPYLAAAVDGLRIHSRALSAAEVSQLNSTGQ